MPANDVRAERIHTEVALLVLDESRMPLAWDHDWVWGL